MQLNRVAVIGRASSPFAKFQYDIDFSAATSRGVAQPYGNNNQDGRAFRDSGNFQVCYILNKAGLLVAQPTSGLRRTDKGLANYPSVSILGLWGADLTNAVWVKTNVTATKNQVGADGVANTATLITATATQGTVIQSITSTVADRVMSAYVKRVSGTGTLEFSVDNGTTWVAVSPTSSYQDLYITQTAVTNPTIAFRIGTSGDSFAIDFSMVTGAMNNQLIPYGYKARTVGTAFGSMSRTTAWALNTDGTPIYKTISNGGFAWYWQGSGDQLASAAPGLFVSDGSFFVQLATNNVVTYGGGQSATNSWVPGVGNINKVAGYTNGTIGKFCVNGQTPISVTAAISPIGTHFVVASNGSGAKANHGYTERVAFGPNAFLSDNELISITK